MKLIILIIVGFILYIISKGYRTEKFQNIKLNIKENFQGDLLKHEAGILIALMAKVAKADGKVCELEAELLKHTFSDISGHFENSHEIREQLKDIYKKEKESFDNTIELAKILYKLTRGNYAKRVKILEYLLNLAFADKDFADAERMITEDISNALEIKKADFDQIVKSFENFYASQAASSETSLEDAYKVLASSKDDDALTLKKNYRKLVKKHHPDIISGQGASTSIIEAATKKLQRINEAYEIVKKSRNI